VKAENVGIILGVSVSLVSLANAGAPVVAGLLFEVYGSTVPFLVGGILMGLLFLAALRWLRPDT
jgi:predicted MFS family arabinose efflux permease